jgi:hypothetical protein
MNETLLLDELVPEFDLPGDWEDVRRRARRGSGRRLALVAAIVCTVLAGSATAAVLLTRDARASLPPGADRANVVVIVQPRTGRVLIQAAPWKRHDGICYVVLWRHAGCVLRRAHRTVLFSPPLVGYTFDVRVAAARGVTLSGRHVRLVLRRFDGRLNVTFFFVRTRIPPLLRRVTFLDRDGAVIGHVTK